MMRPTPAAILASALFFAPSGAAWAAAPVQGPAFNIMGSSSCSAWPKSGKIESAGKAVPLNWVLGFASGEATAADMRLLTLIDPDKVDAWVGAYCEATLPRRCRPRAAP